MLKLAEYFQVLAESFQELMVYSFIVLFWVAVAIFVYIGVRELLDKLRAYGSDGEGEFHPGPFSLRRGSSLRHHFSRRHKVQLRGRWHSTGKWVPRE